MVDKAELVQIQHGRPFYKRQTRVGTMNKKLKAALKQYSLDKKNQYEVLADKIKNDMSKVKGQLSRARTGRTSSEKAKEYRRLQTRLTGVESLIRCYKVHAKIYSERQGNSPGNTTKDQSHVTHNTC